MSDDLVKRLRAIDKDIILRRFDPEMSFDGMTAHEAADRIEKLEAALLGIKIYGNDTMSGPADGSEDNRNWYRGAVIVMKNRARKALEGKDV